MRKPIISAPLNVVTGTLGAGKTLFAIQQADLLVKTGQAKVIYQVGINQPDVRKLPPLPFPLQDWVEHADRGELKDAVVIVDEFHKLMPQRGPGRPPRWVEEFAEARKRGCIFIFLTQSSEFDHFLKGTRLNKHYYLSRKGFLPRSTIYEWTARFVPNPEDDKAARKEAVITLWRHPKQYYDWYVSAERHRFKVRLPLRVWAAFVFVPIAAYFAWNGVRTVQNLASGQTSLLGTAVASPASADVVPVAGGRLDPDAAGKSVVRATSDLGAYLQQFEPLAPHLPWSAPVYQGREIVARPDILCIASGYEGDEDCHCYTEQVTPMTRVPLEICMTIARHGVYNPYRLPMGAGSGGSDVAVVAPGGGDGGASMPAAVAALVPAAGVGTAAAQ